MMKWFIYSLTLCWIVAGGLLPLQPPPDRDARLMDLAYVIFSPNEAYAQEVHLGTYDVNGSNPDGSRYRGTAVIKKVGDKYKITWRIGRQIFYGSGPLTGKTLTIDWRRSDGGESGVVMYKVMKNGTLVGTWANGSATDVLYPR